MEWYCIGKDIKIGTLISLMDNKIPMFAKSKIINQSYDVINYDTLREFLFCVDYDIFIELNDKSKSILEDNDK